MGALGRMAPKPHADMKLGKPRAKPQKSPTKKRRRAASAKTKSA